MFSITGNGQGKWVERAQKSGDGSAFRKSTVEPYWNVNLAEWEQSSEWDELAIHSQDYGN